MSPTELIKRRQQVLPVNIEALIGDFGIELVKKDILDPSISGQIELVEGESYRITVNARESYFRRRFTMAHELAHYILHRDLIGAGVDDTPAYRSTDLGQFHNRNITARHETEANRLAADLLMPADKVREAHESRQSVAELAKLFLVSLPAMEYRLRSLGLQTAT